MTRTLQTALLAFPSHLSPSAEDKVEVQIWPDLREGYDAICNRGISRKAISAKFPQFDFAECNEEWDYEAHSTPGAEERAERVRRRLLELSRQEKYENIAVISHRGIIAFMVQGERFGHCGMYWFHFRYTSWE
jgi:broad specificity phosphatase PhoE